MRTRNLTRVSAAFGILAALGSSISDSYANTGSNFGPAVDAACQALNGTTPFADQSCGLCHGSSFGTRVDPQWGWWETGNLTAFCAQAPNQAPNGDIDAPTSNLSIETGDTVDFAGRGSDPDGNLPLAYHWDFAGGAQNVSKADPGNVTFSTAGAFTVTLTVTDSLGASDPTPPTRTITVNDPPSPGQAPNGTIDTPATDLSITTGETVSFSGTGSDPDGDLPLAFAWDFDGGAPSTTIEDPGSVRFDSAGSFEVTFRVTDSSGVTDPTPGSRTITVEDPASTCTDSDSDGFAAEGGACGPMDCNDADAAINPDAPETCTDGIDNNCNDLIDVVDPEASDCPISDACLDSDGDRYSADGGICGPIDCDDFDQTINPGATEACRDDKDNDCDGAIDNEDTECNGTDCIGRLIGDDNPVIDIRIKETKWDAEKRRLEVKGNKVPRGSVITISNAVDGQVLGTTIIKKDDEWKFTVTLRPDLAPCRVRADINGSFDEKDVKDAPRSICGGRDDDDEDDHEDEEDDERHERNAEKDEGKHDERERRQRR